MLSKRINLYIIFCFVVIASMLLVACGGATPTETQPEQPGAETQPPAAPTEPPTPLPAEKKVATFIWTQEFDSLNPLYTNMWFSTVTHQIWNCWAWNFDDNNEAYPNLLAEMPSSDNGGISEDGKTLTFKLRDGLVWSDGTPLTSADLLFTVNMALEPTNSVASAYPYDGIASIDAPDDLTLVVTFDEPFAPWVATFFRGTLPAHILQPVFDAEGTIDNAEWNLAPTVSCGPYVFAEWESGSFARFVINENYWGERPKIDEIFFRFVPDDASQVAALQTGDGDLGTFIAYSDVPSLQDAGVDIRTIPSGYDEGWFFFINDDNGEPIIAERANSPTRDVRVRKAIAMATDREAIARDLLLGLTGVPASYWDALPFYNTPPLEPYPYDPTGAEALLDEAGWVDSNGDGVREKDGQDLVVTYGTTLRETRQDTQAVVQQMLAEVGIKADLISQDADIFFAGLDDNGIAARGDVDIMEWSDSSYFPDPDYYYWYCSEIPTAEYPQGGNWQYYCNDELDGLFTLQTTQVDAAERQKTFQRINQIFYDEVIWVGLWQDPDLWAVGSRLQNVTISGVTPFFSIAEWDLK